MIFSFQIRCGNENIVDIALYGKGVDHFTEQQDILKVFLVVDYCELYLCNINRLDIPKDIILYGYRSQQNTIQYRLRSLWSIVVTS